MFSSRVPDDRQPNRFAVALARAKSQGRLIDLTTSNPTRVGIRYPETLLSPLANPQALTYCPHPLGLVDAREAIAETYARRGVDISAEQVVLTASTSEAYSLLFKLLCDPASSEVLTPVPSYPLFDHLTRLDGVVQRRYALRCDRRWAVDLVDVDREWTDQTRAILVVSPNNPTGSTLTALDAQEIVTRCAERRAALIIDEVFHAYPLHDDALAEPPALVHSDCLLLRLGGLSKSAGLPQVKLGWVTVEGPHHLVREALDRLELICDSYLSVSTSVQIAARALLTASAVIREQIRERTCRNYRALAGHVTEGNGGVTLLEADGGWSAVLRLDDSSIDEEALVLELLERDRVVVHPGFFFDFAEDGFLVVSLLPEPATFDEGVHRIVERVHAA